MRFALALTLGCMVVRRSAGFSVLHSFRRPSVFRTFGSVTDVTSVRNPEVLSAKKLLRSKRERERSGLVAVEGVRLIGDVMGAGHTPRTVFFCERMMGTEDAQSLLDTILALEDCRVMRVTPQVLNSMCDTVTPQGLLALFDRPEALDPVGASDGEVVLLLSEISDPGNMGTLVRSALALGCASVIVYGKQSVDPLGPKALRASMGSAFQMPIVQCNSLREVTTFLLRRRLWERGAFFAADASHAASVEYSDVDWREGNVVIAIGSEATGLAMDLYARLDGEGGVQKKLDEAEGEGDVQANVEALRIKPIKVPMAKEAESLNAGVAGSIILSEVQRQRRRRDT